jgi:hypothetical protein
MFSRRGAIPSWTVVWLGAIGQLAGATLVRAAEISWQMTDTVTTRSGGSHTDEGGHYVRVGTATFATGEEGRTTLNQTV